ncbi:hypothetical protein MSKU3_1327 [Komagataeibacter oboediens]|nr:hypothetical protein MSKU3_1327 [Komagataeibacter oboediens]
MGRNGVEECLLRRKSKQAEVRGILDFGDQPDHTATRCRFGRDEIDDSLKCGNVKMPVMTRIGRADGGQAFMRAQEPELGQGEICGEPVGPGDAINGLCTQASGVFGAGGDIGGICNLAFVAGDQNAIACRDKIGFDMIRPVRDCPGIGCQRVFGTQGGCATMRHDTG